MHFSNYPPSPCCLLGGRTPHCHCHHPYHPHLQQGRGNNRTIDFAALGLPWLLRKNLRLLRNGRVRRKALAITTRRSRSTQTSEKPRLVAQVHLGEELGVNYKTGNRNKTLPCYSKTTIYKWLFQLDDSNFFLGKWLVHQFHPFETSCLGLQD